MEQRMEDFIRKICKSTSDFSTLTKGILRKQYMQENGLSEMDLKSKKVFSSLVEKILYELINNSQEINKEDQEKISNDQNNPSHGAFSDEEKIENPAKNKDFESTVSYFLQESDSDKDDQNKLIINENLNSKSDSRVDDNSSSSDNSPIKSTHKKILKYLASDDSDSDFTMLRIASKEDNISNDCGTNNKCHSSEKENVKINNQAKKRKSSENEEKNKIKKKKLDFSSSDDEPLAYSKYKKGDKEDFSHKQELSDYEDSSSSDRETSSAKTKNKKMKNNKATSATNSKIENLKKYIRVAGIRVNSYSKLFENCKTLKSKAEKLMELLQKEGLKGRPNLKKCKKLKVKIERRKEIEELDKSKIITSQGRPKRNLYNNSNSNNEQSSSFEKSPKNRFSRLKDIIDSEESE